jgi:peptidoglycan/xylan/chitin deacetylase (PgdA/CDA1 family)
MSFVFFLPRAQKASYFVMKNSTAKEQVKKIVLKSHVLGVIGALAPASAVILMYHSVQHDPQKFADSIGLGIAHAASDFDRQMALIAKHCNPIGLDDILSFVQGRKKLPSKAVAVTFDDGFTDNYEVAAPILARYGIRAAFYLIASLIGTHNPPWYCRLRFSFFRTQKETWVDRTSGRTYILDRAQGRGEALQAAFDNCAPLVGQEQERCVAGIESDLDAHLSAGTDGPPFMMNWEQARRLVEQGHVVGSHTMTHPNMAHVKNERAMHDELADSKKRIEDGIGSSIEHFSYPHPALSPQWSEATVAMTRQTGYLSAVTTTPGPVRANGNPLLLTRMAAPGSERQFLWNLEWTFCGRGVN